MMQQWRKVRQRNAEIAVRRSGSALFAPVTWVGNPDETVV